MGGLLLFPENMPKRVRYSTNNFINPNNIQKYKGLNVHESYESLTQCPNFRYAAESIKAACQWAYNGVRLGSILKGFSNLVKISSSSTISIVKMFFNSNINPIFLQRITFRRVCLLWNCD